MTAEEFFKHLATIASDDPNRFDSIMDRLPLGLDSEKRFVFAREVSSENLQAGMRSRHTCVVGTGRSAFIRRVLLTLIGACDEGRLSVVIVSPKREYAELLKVKNADIFMPVLTVIDDLWQVVRICQEQANLRAGGGKDVYGKLIIVVDGLEDFVGGGLECYLPFFALSAVGVELITGVDLVGSVFSASPQSFVGNGGCLISVTNRGFADVSRVSGSGDMSLPSPFEYPSEPSLLETVALVNEVRG